MNSIRSAVSGEPASEGRSPNEIVRPALRQWNASGREPQMVGDRMVGSSGDVNQGTTAGGDKRFCRGQSVRSSEEAGNDRGAKGRRKAVPEGERRPSRKGRRSAERLSASVRRRTAWPTPGHWQWAVLGIAHRRSADWKAGCGRSARPVWEGGGAPCAPPILIETRSPELLRTEVRAPGPK